MKNVMRCLLAAALALPVLAEEPKPENLKITGYLQGQYVHDDARSQFSVRRARIKLTYQATRTSRLVLEPDFASSGVTLKDGYVELTEPWTKWKHTLTAGQFKWPFGFELLYSSRSREVPERALVTRTLFPGERDRGVMLSGAAHNFSYRLAVVNGSGTQRSDDADKRKDVVARVAYKLGAVDAGASVYRGSDLVSAGVEQDKRRHGADLQWRTPLPGLVLRGEYVRGRQSGAEVEGWIAYAVQELGKRHQLALRADQYEGERTVAGAYSFLWDAHSKAMLAYEVRDRGGDLFTMRYQFSF